MVRPMGFERDIVRSSVVMTEIIGALRRAAERLGEPVRIGGAVCIGNGDGALEIPMTVEQLPTNRNHEIYTERL